MDSRKLQRLPIGIQTFKDIREDNYIYIDKTDIAYDIIDNYKYVFLSRPRRFGKSLFLDTLKNIFEGNKMYFNGLAIEDKWDWDTIYPVIKISFDVNLRSAIKIEESLISSLKDNQKRLDVKCDNTSNVSICFKEFIQAVYDRYNQKVVVLIDEYDKAILDNIDQMDVAREAREIIKGFYTVLKGSDEYLKFVFLTGVSKFSKASIFSGLNMLTDISLSPRFGNICGYTHENIKNEFKEYMQGVNLEKLKFWYNGYNFLKDPLYNPFDVLQLLGNDKAFDNYWFATSTPTFLIKLIEKNNYFLPKLSNLVIGKQLLDSFDIDNLDLEVILYQSGYLTILKTSIDEDEDVLYHLQLPNKEVKKSLNTFIINSLFRDKSLQNKMISQALRDNNLENFKNAFVSIFASIPYNNFTHNSIQNYEGFYASVIYVYLQSLGLDIVGEDVTNKARIDLTIKMAHAIYILEFKVIDNRKLKIENEKNSALQQIKEKNYAQKYLHYTLAPTNYSLYLIGIEFDTEQKNISNFEWESVK